MSTKFFTTASEAKFYIEDAIVNCGQDPKDFDIDAIFGNAMIPVICDDCGSLRGYEIDDSSDDFWTIVQENDISGTVMDNDGRRIDFQAACNLMDPDIAQAISADDDQEFFDTYCDMHKAKFGEDFPPAVGGNW